ncbi:MAG: hypothetical protein ACLU4N_01365 [Butyricimonas faecihominis]
MVTSMRESIPTRETRWLTWTGLMMMGIVWGLDPEGKYVYNMDNDLTTQLANSSAVTWDG